MLTQERATQLGSAHEVQRFHRDVDETKDWIQEKEEALNNDDLGKDLRTVQALQRKHEGLERDLAALGDKVRFRQFFFIMEYKHSNSTSCTNICHMCKRFHSVYLSSHIYCTIILF